MKNIFKSLLFSAALFLSGCGGGGTFVPVTSFTPPPTIITQPSPPSPSSSGTLAFQSNFTGPNIGLELSCNGNTPVGCTLPPGATYGTFNATGNWGQGCVDPGPNICYSVNNGTLTLTAANASAFPIITSQTFLNTSNIIAKATFSGSCYASDCWGGLVIYNGEQDWRSLYLSTIASNPGVLQVKIWSDTHIQDFGNTVLANTFHNFEIDYNATTFTYTYLLDGNVIGVETPNSWSTDTTTLLNPPHIAIFLGDMQLQVTNLSVYTGN